MSRPVASILMSLLGTGLSLLTACVGDASSAGRVGDLQGSGERSPFVGETVSLSGIVSGDFQDRDGDRRSRLGGFFVQDEVPDGDPRTSDGIFVFDARAGIDVDVGDRVLIVGEVVEFFGETQIVADAVTVTGSASIEPTVLELPAESSLSDGDGRRIPDLEHLEGMLVRVAGEPTVIDTSGLEEFGTLLVHAAGRAYQYTDTNRPSVRGYRRHRDDFVRSSLVLDDGRRDMRPTPVRYLFPYDDGRNVRVGDRIAGLTGVIRYSRGSGETGRANYRLMPTEEPRFVAADRQPTYAAKPAGVTRVVSLNTLNFFSTLDAGDNVCGPAALGCRGANSAAEFERQRRKLAAAIKALDADIVGLMEVENDAGRTLETLVGALADDTGNDWDFVDTGAVGGDAIKVALIYRAAAVRPVGRYAILDASVDPAFVDDRNRPVLAQTFETIGGGERLTVAVNHLKSKGSDCEDLGDPDLGDGQANCNRTRTRAAEAEARWLSADPTGSGDPDVLIIGDLNAYRREDPVVALQDAGYEDLVARFATDRPHSFVFRGESGALDHALATRPLVEQVETAGEWHINSDEPRILDYNLDNDRDPRLFDSAVPWRASDHDPIVIDLRLGAGN